MAESPRSLEELVRPHIDSFDYFIGEGLQNIVELLKPAEVCFLHLLDVFDYLIKIFMSEVPPKTGTARSPAMEAPFLLNLTCMLVCNVLYQSHLLFRRLRPVITPA